MHTQVELRTREGGHVWAELADADALCRDGWYRTGNVQASLLGDDPEPELVDDPEPEPELVDDEPELHDDDDDDE